MAFTGFPILNPMGRDEFVKKAREVVMAHQVSENGFRLGAACD
jgi:hypothetical protein